MKQLKIGTKTYPACKETVIYPSGNAAVRNRLEIHLAEDAMSWADFEALLAGDLSEITLEEYAEQATAAGADGEQPASAGDEQPASADDEQPAEPQLLYSTTARQYTILAEIGRKRVDTIDPLTAQITSEMHLVAVLEQPLYIEQLAAQVAKA